MTLAPAPQADLLPSLEECDEQVQDGILLIKDACLNYAKHGLTGTEIGKRVRSLGADLGDRTARRYVQQFKEQGLLTEKEPAERTKRHHRALEKKRQKGQIGQIAAEDDVIDAEVTIVPAEEEVTARSIKDRLKSKPKTYPTNSDVRRNQPERHDQQSDGGPGGDDSYWNVDAEHFQHVQDSDEPDSYKEAQYFLTKFDLLLRKGSRDGWSEEAFNSLRYDLDGFARACAASSNNRRERDDERAEEVGASIAAAVLRGEGGGSTPGIESSELN